MVALAPITNKTPAWDVQDTFPKLHSRAREAKTTACTEVPMHKSRSRIEIWLTIYETCDRLESFTRDPIGYADGWNIYSFEIGLVSTDALGNTPGQWPPPVLPDPNPPTEQDMQSFCGPGWTLVDSTPKDPMNGMRDTLDSRWTSYSSFDNAFYQTTFELFGGTVVSQKCGGPADGALVGGVYDEVTTNVSAGGQITLWKYLSGQVSWGWGWTHGKYRELNQAVHQDGERCTLFKIVGIIERLEVRTESYYYVDSTHQPHYRSSNRTLGYFDHIKSVTCKTKCKEAGCDCTKSWSEQKW